MALRDNPRLNASLAADGEHIVYKQYVHIGMAVDTPAGLIVPVIRDVDHKSLWELAAETAEMAQKARDRKLKPAEMQGHVPSGSRHAYARTQSATSITTA